MKKKIGKVSTVVTVLVFMGVSAFLAFPVLKAFAEGEVDAVGGEAGCAAVHVDPNASLEDQQAVCNAAEQVEASSCGRSGYGTCSSPKLNDIAPELDHCLCIDEDLTVSTTTDTTTTDSTGTTTP